ncbi:hypothetical protein BH23GEM3_BH23GEM3_12530 [soil metagenome]|nr:hypothetical protein [Gemmatimonadota bacterium]
MILHVNFEEVRALSSGADLVLAAGDAERDGAVAAPSEALAEAEALRSQLTGDLSIETLAQQRRLRSAVSLICDYLSDRLKGKVIEQSPGHEESIYLYFDYGHVLTVLHRLDHLGSEMTAMVELMTGAPVTDEAAAAISFPD